MALIVGPSGSHLPSRTRRKLMLDRSTCKVGTTNDANSTKRKKTGTCQLVFQQLRDCVRQNRFDGRSDPGGAGACLVAALAVGDFGADIAGCIGRIGSHGNEQIGTHSLRRQLVRDEQFSGQVQNANSPKSQARDGNRIVILSPARADKVSGGSRPCRRSGFLVSQRRFQLGLVQVPSDR